MLLKSSLEPRAVLNPILLSLAATQFVFMRYNILFRMYQYQYAINKICYYDDGGQTDTPALTLDVYDDLAVLHYATLV